VVEGIGLLGRELSTGAAAEEACGGTDGRGVVDVEPGLGERLLVGIAEVAVAAGALEEAVERGLRVGRLDACACEGLLVAVTEAAEPGGALELAHECVGGWFSPRPLIALRSSTPRSPKVPGRPSLRARDACNAGSKNPALASTEWSSSPRPECRPGA
jgi:hypothetical protein